MLYGILGYITNIEDLKSIYLTSKRLSAVSNPSLYQNLIFSDDLDNTKEMYQIVRKITKGRKKTYNMYKHSMLVYVVRKKQQKSLIYLLLLKKTPFIGLVIYFPKIPNSKRKPIKIYLFTSKKNV